ncbi:MFS transporter [Streptomyces sp. HPF1205]|uniref:MFS transporter n=1 Tax=Streptomyces sp. HPF1205 TaxID=2873262 RepID=UPI001CED6FC0|nr:MFS transporter [Streptomyces sp. HPF1205]
MRTARRPSRPWAALAVLCVSLLIVSLDNTVLNVALPTLVRDLNASTNNLQWVVDSYALVFGGLLLVAGSLADRIGRKWTFLAGLVVFAGGSTWAAFSGSVGVLIAARAGMGVGGAMIMPSTLAIITDMFPDLGDRQKAIGVWSATSGLGIALGPIIGGLLLDHFWWGSVFLINLPIAAAGLLAALALVPNSRNPRASRPDVLGGLLSITGLGAVLWAIIEAPVHGWGSGRVLGVGCAGLAVLVAFLVWERTTSHPMLRLSFFRRRSFSAAVCSVAPTAFGLFGGMFVLTQFLQFDLGYTPLQAGVRLLPTAGAIAVCAPFSAVLVRVLGTKVTATAGLASIAGGLYAISRVSTAATYGDTLAGLVLIGVGTGLVLPAATGSVMGSVPREHTGVGSATNGTFLQVGGALGVAVVGSLLSTRYTGRLTASLSPLHLPAAIHHAVTESLGGALGVAAHLRPPAAAALARAARSAFVSGMDLGLMTAAAVAAAAALFALLALPRSPSAQEEDGDGHGDGGGGREASGSGGGPGRDAGARGTDARNPGTRRAADGAGPADTARRDDRPPEPSG